MKESKSERKFKVGDVVAFIRDNWEKNGRDIEYFKNEVLKSGLSSFDIEEYLLERGKVGPVCVTTVFDSILHPIDDKEGDEA